MVARKTVTVATNATVVPNAKIAPDAKKPIQVTRTVPDAIADVMTPLQKKKRFIIAAGVINLQ